MLTLLWHVPSWREIKQCCTPFLTLIPVDVVSSRMLWTILCFVMLFYLCPWYTFIYSARKTRRQGWDLQLWLISTASCCNTFELSIFWWWRAGGGWWGWRGAGGRWRKTEVHKQCVWDKKQVTEQESERVFVCVGEKKRERNSTDDRRQAATTL